MRIKQIFRRLLGLPVTIHLVRQTLKNHPAAFPVSPKKARREPAPIRFFERNSPNEIWHTDVMYFIMPNRKKGSAGTAAESRDGRHAQTKRTRLQAHEATFLSRFTRCIPASSVPRKARNVLNQRTAQEVWEDEYLHFSKREREAIYNGLKILAAKILDGFSLMQRNIKGAVESAWRKAVRTYPKEKEYIRLYHNGIPLRNSVA